MVLDFYMSSHGGKHFCSFVKISQNSFQVSMQTQFCDRQTDIHSKNNVSYPEGGRHNYTLGLPRYFFKQMALVGTPVFKILEPCCGTHLKCLTEALLVNTQEYGFVEK